MELTLSREAFKPVLARCFNAVTQVAWTFAGLGTCETRTDTTLVARNDTTTGTVTLEGGTGPMAGQQVRVRAVPSDGSGFHLHNQGSRPGGRFLADGEAVVETTAFTDSAGIATFRYQSSGVSGEELVVVEYGPPADAIADTVAISVGLPLHRMPRSGLLSGDSSGIASYTYLIDNTGGHGPDNDNGVTSEAEDAILKIFNKYVKKFGAKGFRDDGRGTTPNNGIGFVIIEGSLPQGGLFDVGPEILTDGSRWQQPHEFHRAGLDFDVRFTNIALGQAFQTICEEEHAKCAREGNHYHVYTAYQRRTGEEFSNG